VKSWIRLVPRDNARNNARCTQARKTTHGLDGQHQNVDRTALEESVRMSEDGDKWRKYVHGGANPRIEDGERTEQNRTEQNLPDKHGVSMMKSVMSSFWRRGNDVTAADADWCTRIYSWLYGHAVERWLSEHWQPAAMPSLSAACYRHVPDSVFKPHRTCARCRL